MYKYVFVIP